MDGRNEKMKKVLAEMLAVCREYDMPGITAWVKPEGYCYAYSMSEEKCRTPVHYLDLTIRGDEKWLEEYIKKHLSSEKSD